MTHQPSSEEPRLPKPGDILLERYVIEGAIDRGGFGAVYRGRQLGVDRVVAIKCLDPASIYMDPGAPQRFEKEARLVSGLQHQNTITIFDYGCTSNGILFLVMEYVRGIPLYRLIQKGPIKPERAVHLIRQVLSALREAHANQIIHRDLKPANIMVCDRGGEHDVIKVLDFGIAKTLGEFPGVPMDITMELTGADKLIGTPQYMSPEQIRGEPLSPASDLYSVGLILYEMLAGKAAIEETSTMIILGIQLKEEPIAVPRDGSIPEHLVTILERALQKEPQKRYRSADEFLNALEIRTKEIPTRRVDTDQHIFTEPLDRDSIRALESDSSVIHRSGREYKELSEGVAEKDVAEEIHLQAGPVPAKKVVSNLLVGVGLLLVGIIIGAVVVQRMISSGVQSRYGAEGGPQSDQTDRIPDHATRWNDEYGQEVDFPEGAASTLEQPRITVTFSGVPEDAEMYLGQVNIGRAGEPIDIPTLILPAQIEVRRAGYLSRSFTVSQQGETTIGFRLDRTTRVRLEPIPSQAGGSGSEDRMESRSEPATGVDSRAVPESTGEADSHPTVSPPVGEDRETPFIPTIDEAVEPEGEGDIEIPLF